MITFTLNKRTGTYDIIGPVDSLAEGQPAIVCKKDGSTTTVTVGKRSKPFTAKFGPLQGRTVVIATVQNAGGPQQSIKVGKGGQSHFDVQPTKTCWECGCQFTYEDARRYDGDWQDSYCGC